MPDNPWLAATGGAAGARYASRFAALEASGRDVHGEARMVSSLVPPASPVLDAGCGTGRVAIRLAALGHPTVGVDIDPSMLDQARRAAPELRWVAADLSTLDLADHGIVDRFTVVVAAGNVLPLLTPGTESAAVNRLAAALQPDGLLVAGFGLDREHLPVALPADLRLLDLGRYDACCVAAGLELVHRWSTWDGAPFAGGGYAVSVHRRAW